MGRQAVPVLSLSVVAAAAITAHRFALANGTICGANGNAKGVYISDAEVGELVGITVLGTAIVESGAAFAVDANLQSDALGRAVTAVDGPVVARALEAATAAGQLVEVLVIASPSTIADGAKLAQVLASNDITRPSADGAVPISGIALIDGGTGIAGLTLAAPQPGCQARIKLDTLSSGTVVLTTAAGVTFDGTNNTATYNAAGDELVLGYKSATEWEVIENTSVTLSAV